MQADLGVPVCEIACDPMDGRTFVSVQTITEASHIAISTQHADLREQIEQAIAAGWLKGGGFDIEPAADAVMAAIFGSSAT